MEFSRMLFHSSGDIPNPGIKPRSPALQADSLPAEPSGNPKNTGVGSLSLLQGIFPTQESNPGPSHCRQIFTDCHEGSPDTTIDAWNIYFNLFIVTFIGQDFFYPTGLEIGWPMVDPISTGFPQWLWFS